MEFRIADTFTDSLARLTGEEQKAVKTTAFDLQLNPAAPGLSFHKLDRARDKNFWSVRAGRDIRLRGAGEGQPRALVQPMVNAKAAFSKPGGKDATRFNAT